MYPSPNEIDLVLNTHSRPGEILRNLYLLFRSYQRKMSYNFICRHLGINSKGHLAYLMNGQRRIHREYWPRIFQVFKLNEEQENKFREILEAEYRQNEEKALSEIQIPVRELEVFP